MEESKSRQNFTARNFGVFAVALLALLYLPAHAQDQGFLEEPYTNEPGYDEINEEDLVLDLGNWSRLSEEERQEILISGIESYLIIRQSIDPEKDMSSDKCLRKMTLKKVEKQMLKRSKEYPAEPVSSAFANVIECEKN